MRPWFNPFPIQPGGAQPTVAALDRRITQATTAHLHLHLHLRRSLAAAVAIALHDAQRRLGLSERAADLEQRALISLRGAPADPAAERLAAQAAEVIVALQDEVADADRAIAAGAADIARLRRAVADDQRRLADLRRGIRQAALRAALQEARDSHSSQGSHLDAAEAALADLTSQQNGEAMLAADAACEGARLADEMGDAGFGAPVRPRGADVLVRLRALANPASSGPRLARAAATDPSTPTPIQGDDR